MRVSLIAAVSDNNIIGHKGQLPWRQQADLMRFRTLTTNCPLIMGRKTWESIRSPLLDRLPIVLSRDPNYTAQGVFVANSFENALDIVSHYHHVFVGGGREVYVAAMPYAHSAFITRIHAFVEGDTEFPRGMGHDWILENWHSYPADRNNQYPYTYEIWRREC